jgi:hypothetical protein
MNSIRSSRRRRQAGVRGALAVVIATLAASPSLASAATTTAANCTMPTLSTPFTSFGDGSQYALVPGEALNSFTGTGWTLTGGARIVTTTLYGGTTTGPVLDLPAGSKAVSPLMCVDNDFPSLRTMIRQLTGRVGVTVEATLAGASTPISSGTIHAQTPGSWGLSGQFHTQLANQTGWQLVQFTLLPGGTSGESQIYNLYVDPRMT